MAHDLFQSVTSDPLIEDKRARDRAKEKGLPAHQRRAQPRLVEGATIQGWKAALGALSLAYPDRLDRYL